MAYMERVMTKLQEGTNTRRRRQISEVGTQTNTQKDDDKSSDSESTYLMHPEQAYELTSNSVKIQKLSKVVGSRHNQKRSSISIVRN